MKALLIALLLSASCWAQAPDGPKPQHGRIFDLEYGLHVAAFGAAISSDSYTAATAGSGCIETGRLLGPHPSNRKLIKHSLVEFGIGVLFDTALKYFARDTWAKHFSYAGTDGLAIWHGHAAYQNARLC